jgi:hypothetical protein
MRAFLSYVACATMLTGLAACNLPPANPNADHGAENLHLSTNSATGPAQASAASAQRAVND